MWIPSPAAHFIASATVDTANLGVVGKQMALWVFNASTLAAATQQAILYWDISNTATNPDSTATAPGARWAFPSGTTSVDITDLTTGSTALAAGARVVIGTFPTGISDISDAPNFGLATISAPPSTLAISTNAALPGGMVGTAYSQALVGTGGTGSHAWDVQSGTLPGGITLSAAGLLSGTPDTDGTFNFTARVTDAANATATKAFAVTISPQLQIGDVTHTTLAQAGGGVSGAGGTSAAGGVTIPAGAIWGDVGQPAIDDAGRVAYLGKWKAGKLGSSGIFRDDVLIVGAGDTAPDAGGATFATFYDPLIGPDGSVAFLATLKGAGVTGTNKWALCVFAGNGTGKLIARSGGIAPDADGALFASFGDVAYVGSTSAPRLYFTAKLRRGAPVLPAGTASGVWLADPATSAVPRLAVRAGGTLAGFAFGEKIGSLSLFLPLKGSAGQGRGAESGGGAHLFAVLNTKRQVLIDFDGSTSTVAALSGETVGGTQIPTAQWKSFRLPSSAADGSVIAFYGTLVPKVAGVTTANSPGIFLGDAAGFEPLVRPGQVATALGTATFKSVLDPVLSPDGDAVAFSSIMRGAGVTPTTDQVLWLADSNATLSVLAREGTDAVGGGTWKAFSELAFPGGGRGPLFLASLKPGGGVTGANDAGAWAVDSKGTLRPLFREGDTIDGQLLKSFTLLKPTVGSKGVTRSFNANGVVAWRAVFASGAAILRTTIP